MQSRADVRGQTDSVGKATAEDARRAEGSSVRWKRNGDGRFAPTGQTRYFLLQPSLPLIQATLVRGALVLDTPARPIIQNTMLERSSMCQVLSQGSF